MLGLRPQKLLSATRNPSPTPSRPPNGLRDDCLLDEVLDAGPDPLHLTAVFGLSVSAAERFTIPFSDTLARCWLHVEPHTNQSSSYDLSGKFAKVRASEILNFRTVPPTGVEPALDPF